MNCNKGEKEISKSTTYSILFLSLASIGTCIMLNIPLYYGFFCGILFSIVILMKNQYLLSELLGMMGRGIKGCSMLFVIIILIGATIAIWLGCGIVPALIYYGFFYINHINYLLACFLISALISFIMGTALGTVSTIGMALFAIGKGISIPPPILLGAIISGAFVADKVSPISSLVNLTLKITESKYRDFIKSAVKTLIPLLVLCSTFYYFIGQKYIVNIDSKQISLYKSSINAAFAISPILLFLPLIVILLAIAGVQIIPNMSLGLLGGICISYFIQKIKFSTIIQILFFGYKSNTPINELNAILRGGGIITMIEVILIVVGAVCLNSIFDETNLIRPIIGRQIDGVKSKGNLIAKTAILSGILTTVTCDQTVGILVPGKFLMEKYKELKVQKEVLARTIADSGTSIAPLEPWNVNAIIITAITGISAVEYGPYTMLCYLSPIITMAIGAWSERKRKSCGVKIPPYV